MKLDRLRPFDAAPDSAKATPGRQGSVVLRRLRGRKTCERVLRRGQVWRGKHMKVMFLKSEARSTKSETCGLFVGTIASTKLEKSAVKRNRMRRRCREALRVTLRDALRAPQDDTAVQLLISPRLSSLTCDFEELLQDIENFLKYIQSR